MNGTICTEHDRLVVDLARGRLDGAAAVEAEHVRSACPQCAAWWAEATAVPAQVEAGVAEGFAAFVAPAHHRRPGWLLPAAAAAGLAVAVGLGVLVDRGASSGSDPVAAMPQAAEALSVIDFESPSSVVAVRAEDDAEASLLVDGMESGDLSSWASNT